MYGNVRVTRILESLFRTTVAFNGSSWKVQLLQFYCFCPVTEEVKKLRSGLQLTVSIRLTSESFTSKLTDKTSREYRDLAARVITAVRTH